MPTKAQAISDGYLQQGRAAKAEQQALIDMFPLASQYPSLIERALTDKHAQVDRITDKLESMIQSAEDSLNRLTSTKPSLFKRSAWDAAVLRQQAAINVLRDRLETIHELRDGMGVTGPRIHELAETKARFIHPDFAREWDQMREAARRHDQHQAMIRKQQQQQQQQQQRRRSGRFLAQSNDGDNYRD